MMSRHSGTVESPAKRICRVPRLRMRTALVKFGLRSSTAWKLVTQLGAISGRRTQSSR
jgi:hypothetical protein